MKQSTKILASQILDWLNNGGQQLLVLQKYNTVKNYLGPLVSYIFGLKISLRWDKIPGPLDDP